MKKVDFKFPIIVFSSSIIHIARNQEEILICSETALKNDFYKGIKIIDSSGNLFNIENAIKIKGHGFFWGYNIFLNQKIEVELIINKPPTKIDINFLKEMILKNLKKSFLNFQNDYNEIINKFMLIDDVTEVINFFSQIYYNEP